MGLGDEIMALGRAEREFERTGKPVSIVTMTESPREHIAWQNNPAWSKTSPKRIIDGGGARPYIQYWKGKQAIFNLEYRARAGEIILDYDDFISCTLEPPYAIVAPFLKKGASPNKNWGQHRWEETIKDFPIPVYQLLPPDEHKVIEGAKAYRTNTIKEACAAISNAAIVICSEGGTHHMAASMRVPAVVVFGSFVPPQVTGYDFHCNISVETEHGYCGNWNPCEICKQSMKQIKPETVREHAILMMESYDAD